MKRESYNGDHKTIIKRKNVEDGCDERHTRWLVKESSVKVEEKCVDGGWYMNHRLGLVLGMEKKTVLECFNLDFY